MTTTLQKIYAKIFDNGTKKINAKSVRESFALMDDKIEKAESGIKGILKITSAKPIVAGKYELADIGTYTALVPIIPAGSTTAQSTPITTEDGYYNAVYFDGSVFTQIKTKLPSGKTIENYDETKSYPIGSQVFFNNDIWEATSLINAGESPEINITKWGGKPLVLGSLTVEKLGGKGNGKVGYSGEAKIDVPIGKETNLIMLNDYSFDKVLDITKINVRLASNETQTNFNFYQVQRNGNNFTVVDTIPVILDKTKYGNWQTVDVSSLGKKSIEGAMLGFDSASHVRANDAGKHWLVFDKNSGAFVFQITDEQTVSFNAKVEGVGLEVPGDDKVPSLALLNSKIEKASGSSGSGSGAGGVWMLSGEHTIANFNYSEATKIGVILAADTSSTFENGYIESPSIIWDENLLKYVMVYTAYSANHTASIGWAVSDDLITWQRKGQLKVASGDTSKGDGFGLTGPCLVYFRNKYYLFALGLNSAGYEGEPINMVLFTTDSLTNPNWNHRGIVIPIQTSIPWCNEAIYHPHPCYLNGKWYMFFNARGNINGYSAERCGFATADKLDGVWTVDPNRISEFAEKQSGQMFIMCGDPAIMEYKNNYYMFYFNLEDGAVDHWAYASKADFPRGWRYGGQASVKTLPQEVTYAHKPFIIKKGSKLYHYYTGVSGQSRSIILQTFDL